MTLKGHTILYLLIAIAIIAAAVVAMTYLIHPGSQTETQGADAVPETSSYGNQTYSTANSGTSQEIEENLTSVPSAPPALVSESDSNTDYVVRIFEGKIGVFTKDGTTPLQVLEVFVDTLPEQDQAVLETGIMVTGRENLRKTLEDYES